VDKWKVGKHEKQKKKIERVSFPHKCQPSRPKSPRQPTSI
jgi:hypothetical protein